MSFNDKKIVKSALPFRNHPQGAKWWLKHESMKPISQVISGAIADIEKGVNSPNIEILKFIPRRAVFRLSHPEDKQQSFVVKAIILNSLKRKLKYHAVGLNEAANLITAKKRGIPVPEVYGYGQIAGICGIPKATVIILEDLCGFHSIGILMRRKSREERCRMFMQTIPLFADLYKADCNHIDMNAGAVMLPENGTYTPVFLTDFQYAKFYDSPSTEILMFEAGYFAKACSDWIEPEIINDWLDELFKAVDMKTAAERQKMKELFCHYFKDGADMSRKQRMSLK